MEEQKSKSCLFTYYVKDLHCHSCEIILEKKIKNLTGVEKVDASFKKGQVAITTTDDCPSVELLNELFKKENYVFSKEKLGEKMTGAEWLAGLLLAILIIAVLEMLNWLGLSSFINLNSSSSLMTILLFGLLAGFSSCAALVGGLVLSLSKNWFELSGRDATTMEKLKPHFIFNLGRLLSYMVLGAVLGLIGEKIRISLVWSAGLVILISIVMLLLGLQLLGVRQLQKIRLALPKKWGLKITEEKKFKGKYAPFILGALTFFLPCGFTIAAQGIALLSGSPLRGALVMGFFALGTLPALIIIGFSSVELLSRPNLARKFSQLAGVLVIIFALFNIQAQLKVLDLGNAWQGRLEQNENATPTGQIQIIKMNASSRGYSPNSFQVKVGIPVRWEITDTGTSGCTNAVISRSLFSGSIDLTPGQTAIKEFTPTRVGTYKFSCWMGMISGTIEVTN